MFNRVLPLACRCVRSFHVGVCRSTVLIVIGVLACSAARAAGPGPAWTIVERTIVQDLGHWRVEYRLRLESSTALVLGPDDVKARVEASVSNSRVPSHTAPRPSLLLLSSRTCMMATTDVVPSNDEARRCRERARMAICLADRPPAGWADFARKPIKGDDAAPAFSELKVPPGGEVLVRLRLEHDHFLHGAYDPLLGVREVTLELGPTSFRDRVPLDREHYLALPPAVFAPPPADRLDTRYFVTAPDSLHLESHVPGNASYKLTEQPVRYATLMRLSYWYLIACGTEGECRVRIQQSREAPNSYKMLSEGSRDEVLPIMGRWVHVEYVFRTEPEATNLMIDFRIAGADVGEMWVDDVQLAPVSAVTGP